MPRTCGIKGSPPLHPELSFSVLRETPMTFFAKATSTPVLKNSPVFAGMNVKGAALSNPWFWVGFIALALSAGCAEKAAVVPKEPAPPAPEIAPMGFSVQVGAFTDLHKAVRLTRSLESQGVAAYYFRHDSGFFKVRFGNFPSREKALNKAESLLASGIIEDYYIVGPEEYAVAKARIYGTQGLRDEIVRTSENFIGLPYQWGGASPEQGFDCSGLTMAVYQLNGLNLPRSSRDQYMLGMPIERRRTGQRRPGLFFLVRRQEGFPCGSLQRRQSLHPRTWERQDHPVGQPFRWVLRFAILRRKALSQVRKTTQCKMALETITTEDVTSLSREELLSCVELGKALTSELDSKNLFRKLLKRVSELMPAENWSLLLLDESTGELRFELSVDLDLELGEGYPIAPRRRHRREGGASPDPDDRP